MSAGIYSHTDIIEPDTHPRRGPEARIMPIGAESAARSETRRNVGGKNP